MTETKFIPAHTTEFNMGFNAFKTVEHPLLQALVNSGALVCQMMGEVTVFGADSHMLLKVYPSKVYLECIATPVECRGQGSATKLLEVLKAASDKSGVPVALHATAVKHAGSRHPTLTTGAETKGKIPVAKLTAWYKQHGFQQTEAKSAEGVPMVYTPRKAN